jgi:hypothetical protein
MIRQHPVSFVLAVVVACALTTVAVRAAGTGGVSVRVPYTGHLDLNGSAVTAATNMTFTIFDDPTAGAQLAQDQLIVTPANGLFSVVLGGGSDTLTKNELDAKELWLEIAVEGTVIGARQQIFAATQAVRADVANNFTVHGVLTANGGMNLPTDECVTFNDLGNRQFDLCNGSSGVSLKQRGTQNAPSGVMTIATATAQVTVSSGGLTVASGNVSAVDGNVKGETLEVGPFNLQAVSPSDDTNTAAFEHIPNSSGCTPGRIELRSRVVDGGASNRTDGLCICMHQQSQLGLWCVHP